MYDACHPVPGSVKYSGLIHDGKEKFYLFQDYVIDLRNGYLIRVITCV